MFPVLILSISSLDMSWNTYIDNLIAQSSDNCDKACIIGFDGSQWTTKDHSNNFNLSTQEIATITRILSKLSSFKLIFVSFSSQIYRISFVKLDLTNLFLITLSSGYDRNMLVFFC